MLNIANYQKNGNQNYNEVFPHRSEWPSSKSLQIINAGGVEKKEPSYIAGGNWYSQYGGFLKNYKLPYDPAIPLLDIYPQKLKTLI